MDTISPGTFTLLLLERDRQKEKYGPEDNNHPLAWLAILNKQLGQASKASLDMLNGEDETMYEEALKVYKKKLISLATVALAAVEQLNNE